MTCDMSNGGVCRTAPATQGLLNIFYHSVTLTTCETLREILSVFLEAVGVARIVTLLQVDAAWNDNQYLNSAIENTIETSRKTGI